MLLSEAFSQDSGFQEVFNYYRGTLSNIRPNNCPHYPSCSVYSETAINTYGLIKGSYLTTDRLLRCGHEAHFYPQKEIENEIKLLDYNLISKLDTLNDQKLEEQFIYRNFNDPLDSLSSFFNYLFENNFIHESIIEYNRIMFFYPELRDFKLEYNYLRALFSLGKYEEIVNNMDKYKFQDSSLIKIKIAESYFKLGDSDKAINTLDLIYETNYQDKSNDLKGYIFSNNFMLDQARANYKNISESYIYSDYTRDNLSLINDFSKNKYKNKTIAGILGIIPGGGYLYSNHTSTAIASLILNSLFTYATISSFQNNNRGAGILIGTFGSAFYLGNIFGGVKSADRYNQHKKSLFKENLKYSFNN